MLGLAVAESLERKLGLRYTPGTAQVTWEGDGVEEVFTISFKDRPDWPLGVFDVTYEVRVWGSIAGHTEVCKNTLTMRLLCPSDADAYNVGEAMHGVTLASGEIIGRVQQLVPVHASVA